MTFRYMIEQFTYLNQRERALVMDVPALITIWIAGSDENIDQREMERGLDLMKWKKSRSRPDLHTYYQEVSNNFPGRLDAILRELPKEKKERDAVIEQNLARLNTIFPKFNREFAEQLYASYCEFAKNVAEASGGFLGYLSVNMDESKRIMLPMVDDPRTYNV